MDVNKMIDDQLDKAEREARLRADGAVSFLYARNPDGTKTLVHALRRNIGKNPDPSVISKSPKPQEVEVREERSVAPEESTGIGKRRSRR